MIDHYPPHLGSLTVTPALTEDLSEPTHWLRTGCNWARNSGPVALLFRAGAGWRFPRDDVRLVRSYWNCGSRPHRISGSVRCPECIAAASTRSDRAPNPDRAGRPLDQICSLFEHCAGSGDGGVAALASARGKLRRGWMPNPADSRSRRESATSRSTGHQRGGVTGPSPPIPSQYGTGAHISRKGACRQRAARSQT